VVAVNDMTGFDPEYASIEDYTLRSSRKIWQDKALGLIYTHYAHNVTVHRSDGETYGRDAVLEHAVRTLAAIPDLQLSDDEVISSGDQNSFLVSHLVTVSGHHFGYSQYGTPNEHPLECLQISMRLVRENRVLEEWVVTDEITLIRQLGLDEIELAKSITLGESTRGMQAPVTGLNEIVRSSGQHHPPIQLEADPNNPDELPMLLYGLIWNARMLDQIKILYAPNAEMTVPGNRKLEGHDDLTRYMLGLLAAFPDGAINLDRVVHTGNEAAGFLISARWTFQGTHLGLSAYGKPMGRRVRFIGISHLEVRDGQIQREQMVWDEFALLKQIHWQDKLEPSVPAPSELKSTEVVRHED
jgi:predicted ester cyclase